MIGPGPGPGGGHHILRIRGSSPGTSSDSARPQPAMLLQAVLERGGRTDEGTVIQSIGPAWLEIVAILKKDPQLAFSLAPERWEEIIAASYDAAGFDEVILTPRSGDKGRDVIAVKRGLFTVRFVDQVKAYAAGHLVTANDARALIGVVSMDAGVSKGILTTTSDFAPRMLEDSLIRPLVPDRLQLFNGKQVVERLSTIADGKPVL
jgi:restriction system protein